MLGALLLSTLVLAGGTIVISQAASAQESAQSVEFSIPAGPLSQALMVWGRQAGVQISYLDAVTSGKSTSGLTGNLRPEQALARLLSGSGLHYSFSDPRSVVISGRSASAGMTAPDGSILLDTITLNASGAATEGSGSYATREASIARGAESLKDVPQSVTVVTRQAIEDQNLTTMEQTMARTPGIVATREATSAPAFYSRGFKINNYQIDGMGTAYESSFRPDFDMAIHDRAEVLRGAEGLFSGSGEPGGSVNLARKRPSERLQSSIVLSYGSWQNRRIEADIGGPLTRDGALRGRLVGAWQDRDFFYSPGDEKKHVLYGVLEYDLTPDTTVSAGVSYQRQKGNKWFLGLPTWDDFQFMDIDAAGR